MSENIIKEHDKEPRDQDLHLRLTKSELEELEMASYAIGKTKSDIMRRAVKMFLANVNKPY